MLKHASDIGAEQAEMDLLQEMEKEAIIKPILSALRIGARRLGRGEGLGSAMKGVGRGYRSAWHGYKKTAPGKAWDAAGFLAGVTHGNKGMFVGMPLGGAIIGGATAGEGNRMRGAFGGAVAGLGASAGMMGASKGLPWMMKGMSKGVGNKIVGSKLWKGMGKGQKQMPKMHAQGIQGPAMKGTEMQSGLQWGLRGAAGSAAGLTAGAAGLVGGFAGFGYGNDAGAWAGNKASNAYGPKKVRQEYFANNQRPGSGLFNPVT